MDKCVAISSGKGSLIRCHAFLMRKERSRLPGDRGSGKEKFYNRPNEVNFEE